MESMSLYEIAHKPSLLSLHAQKMRRIVANCVLSNKTAAKKALSSSSLALHFIKQNAIKSTTMAISSSGYSLQIRNKAIDNSWDQQQKAKLEHTYLTIEQSKEAVKTLRNELEVNLKNEIDAISKMCKYSTVVSGLLLIETNYQLFGRLMIGMNNHKTHEIRKMVPSYLALSVLANANELNEKYIKFLEMMNKARSAVCAKFNINSGNDDTNGRFKSYLKRKDLMF